MIGKVLKKFVNLKIVVVLNSTSKISLKLVPTSLIIHLGKIIIIN
jgi:hypothetical protein